MSRTSQSLGGIVTEMTDFLDIADSEGVHVGDVHLEMSAELAWLLRRHTRPATYSA